MESRDRTGDLGDMPTGLHASASGSGTLGEPVNRNQGNGAHATGKRPAPLRYPGSKWSIADRIVSYFGDHYHYVEPYFGSGAVFFTKAVSPHEVINDANGTVVNFFRVLRDQTDELCWALEVTPWARDEYADSDQTTGDSIEDARRFAVRVWQAHASDLAKKTGWKNRGSKQRARGMSVRWQRVPSELAELAHRSQRRSRSRIGRPSKSWAASAGEDCLIYADPPWSPVHHEPRGCTVRR